MRFTLIALFAGSAFSCFAPEAGALPPISNELMLPLGGKATTYANFDDSSGGIPVIERGRMLGVACADVNNDGADVRVIMALTPGQQPTGYSSVLATDQTITTGTVHVRVPDVPQFAHHTVYVRVYITDKQGMHTCDAGRVRIV